MLINLELAFQQSHCHLNHLNKSQIQLLPLPGDGQTGGWVRFALAEAATPSKTAAELVRETSP